MRVGGGCGLALLGVVFVFVFVSELMLIRGGEGRGWYGIGAARKELGRK